MYEAALTNRRLFRDFVRPLLYLRTGGDPERVHEFAIDFLRKHESTFESTRARFDFPDLQLDVLGRRRIPFGTAAGFDKDGDALYPLGFIFGFEEPGTVVLAEREGNPMPRIAVDGKRRDLYNAQGFPSKGANHFLSNIRSYKERNGEAPLLVSISGLPAPANPIESSLAEMETLAEMVGPYADGLVWNPFSPNTASLRMLRTKETFLATAELLKKKVGRKAKLVKMGPYEDEPEARSEWLGLLRGWMDGGGDGAVCVNTYTVPRTQVPAGNWGYPTAGRSGRFLREYRNRALRDARAAFPESLIVATGGIDTGLEAWNAFEAGANLIEGYTPYIFEGFGLLRDIALQLRSILRDRGYKDLSGYIQSRHD